MADSLSNEKNAQLHSELDSHGLQIGHEGFVEWKLDAKRHPRNWNIRKKAFDVGLVCFFEFWMTAISSSGVCCHFFSSSIFSFSNSSSIFSSSK